MTAPETRLWRWTRKRFLWIVGAAVLLAGVLLRYPYLPLQNFDLSTCYVRWLGYFESFGLSAAFRPEVEYNYSVPFACLFTLYAKVFGSANGQLIMKGTGLALELLTDGLCLWLILSLLPKERRATGALTGLALIWLNPIMIWNVAAWGQTDVYYLLFSVLSVFLLIRCRPGWALLCLGVALALKLQAIFLAPLFLMVWLCGSKRFSCLWFLALPGMVVVSGLPALLVGESPLTMLSTYWGQGEMFNVLTMNKYNLYWLLGPVQFSIDDATVDMFFRTGLVLCVATLGGMLVWMTVRKVTPTGRTLLLLGAWCVLCCNLLLPRMHERYALVGEVLLCCWAACLNKPRGYAYVLAVMLPTLGTYANALFDATFLDAQLGGVISLAIFCALTWEMMREMSVPAQETDRRRERGYIQRLSQQRGGAH